MIFASARVISFLLVFIRMKPMALFLLPENNEDFPRFSPVPRRPANDASP